MSSSASMSKSEIKLREFALRVSDLSMLGLTLTKLRQAPLILSVQRNKSLLLYE